MKKYLNIIAIGILGMTLSSCEKDSFNYSEGMVGISKVTVFPTLTLKGERYVAIARGSTYTDAGADAKVGETTADVVITGQVNPAVPGVYTLVYSAANSDGFSASRSRSVVVYDTQADAAANDLSGTYLREATGAFSIWSKIAPGVYLVVNPGGALAGTGVTVIAVNPTGSTISIPQQDTDSGPWGSRSENYDLVRKSYTWVVLNPGYGTGSRTFVKQ